MEIGGAIGVGAVDGVSAGALLIAYGQARDILHMLAPADAEDVGVPVAGIIRHTRYPEVSLAVKNIGKADRSGEIAAGEDGGGGIHAAGIGDGLIIGVRAGLIVERLDIEGKEIWIVVG